MYTIPDTLQTEIKTLRQHVSDFKNNKTEAVKFKAIRVPMGIYEQRENDTYMVRVRCTGGIITPAQLSGVSKAARKFGTGDIHITTRQELQIHNVKLEDTPDLLQNLYELGLSTRGGGGNTIRNIMASDDAGISPNEEFDVTPHLVALTNILIAEADSWSLPRKLKIAFSGNDQDNSNATFNDIGFIAKNKNGEKGFRVFIGGGLGSRPSKGHLLFDFLPEEDLIYVSEAVKKLFSKHGNRRNRHKARLRYLFYKLGKEKVFSLFYQYYNELREKNNYPLKLRVSPLKTLPGNRADEADTGSLYAHWTARYVKEQKQPGLYSIEVPFEHGITGSDQLEALADFLKPLGEDVLRLTMRQNIKLRNIPGNELLSVYNQLKKLETQTDTPRIINNLVACTGADTCRLGICLSKGASSAIRKKLNDSNPELLDSLDDVRINLSGCPNSCGQHPVADLGFYGKASRNDRLYPAYYIMVGGQPRAETARLGEKVGEISARDLPELTHQILENYAVRREDFSNFLEYLEAEGRSNIEKLLNEYKEIPSFEEDKNYYFDWGGQEIFSVKGKGQAECSAGMFDMIDFDREAISSQQKELHNKVNGKKEAAILNQIVFHASRMLLVTRGIEPQSRKEVFDGFLHQFIKEEYISNHFSEVVILARNGDLTELPSRRNEVFELATRVNELYDSMDDSLQFKVSKEAKEAATEKRKTEKTAKESPKETKVELKKHFKDFRGVACPMNFVKTKIELANLQSGELLEILLDDGAPVNNVPGSVKEEGHDIVSVNKQEGHWSVLIKKS